MTTTARRVVRIISTGLLALLLLLVTLSYVYYLEMKKILLAKISARSTVFIGQKVDIGDMSFSPSAGITLHDITVQNPKGFAQGQLLRIERIFLSMKYRALFSGRFHFHTIAVHFPELAIVRDANGRLNLSEKLMQFFAREPTIRYQIDEFAIIDGTVDINGDKRFRNHHVRLSLRDLSSEKGRKTLIRGSTILTGESRVKIDGWAYLKDEPKRLNISVSSQGFSLSALGNYFESHGIDTNKAKVIFVLSADGDTGKGFHLSTDVRIKNAEFSFLRDDLQEILVNMQAFLSIPDQSLSIENISLRAGGLTAASAKGEIRKTQQDVSYNAVLNISNLDLSVLNFMKDMKIRGIVHSENLRVRGSLKKALPQVAGSLRLKDGAFSTKTEDIAGIHAECEFLSGGEMAVKAQVRATLSKAFGYLLSSPADTDIILHARGTPDVMTMTSSAKISPVRIHTKEGKMLSAESIAFDADSTVRHRSIAGKSRLTMKGVQVGGHTIPLIHGRSTVAYREHSITATDTVVEGEGFNVSAGHATISLPGKTARSALSVDMQRFNAAWTVRDAGIRDAAFSLRVAKRNALLSGDVGFSVRQAFYGGSQAGVIRGKGRFNDREFSLDITDAQVPRGNLKLTAKGKMAEGPFPIKITASAENIDMENLSKAASKISGVPYSVTGNIKTFSFEGMVSSAESLTGKAGMQAEKVFVLDKKNRNVLREGMASGEIDFRGEDADFRLRAAAGKITADMSGSVQSVMKKERTAAIRIRLPELYLTDIRETFWDVFPDSMLYTGLEGSVAPDLSVRYGRDTLNVSGNLACKDVVLQGENGEYSIGPVNGIIPVIYSRGVQQQKGLHLPSFERTEFSNLRKYYSHTTPSKDFTRITIGSVNYGFRFLENVEVWIKQDGGFLNISHFSGNIFGGKLNGSAVIDMTEDITYRAGILLEGLSLTRLCDSMEPIKGYISGKVNGIASLKGSGRGIAELIGKADFWTYSTDDEKTKISREFLREVGGPSIKAYLGDRKFSKGIMNLYLQKGFVIFRELEISNRNFFGIQDLSVKVAPFNNRIAIDHLMWSITEAAQRAKKKG
ncbi:MAG: AsmA family protein [Nitrospirota bacterium]